MSQATNADGVASSIECHPDHYPDRIPIGGFAFPLATTHEYYLRVSRPGSSNRYQSSPGDMISVRPTSCDLTILRHDPGRPRWYYTILPHESVYLVSQGEDGRAMESDVLFPTPERPNRQKVTVLGDATIRLRANDQHDDTLLARLAEGEKIELTPTSWVLQKKPANSDTSQIVTAVDLAKDTIMTWRIPLQTSVVCPSIPNSTPE